MVLKLAVIAGLLVCVWLIALLLPAIKRAYTYMRNMSTCGYLPPPPTERATRFGRRFCKFILWIQVGKIKFIGLENLDSPGPYLVAPNHPHWVDPGVMFVAVNRPARYMAARGVMKAFFGLGGLLAGPWGGFAADLDKGKGGPARESAVQVLINGEKLVMFPEGWAYLDGGMRPFKKGAVRIARAASEHLGKSVPIIPVYLRYGRSTGSWISKLPPPLEYLFVFINAWYYRRGVTAVIGRPIDPAALPEDTSLATEELFRRVKQLDPGAKLAN